MLYLVSGRQSQFKTAANTKASSGWIVQKEKNPNLPIDIMGLAVHTDGLN